MYIELGVKWPIMALKEKRRQRHFRIRLPMSAESSIRSSTLLRDAMELTVIEELKEQVEHINSK
jgi:hypothetical protein